MGCGITTVKYLLFIFNLVFALCGLAILIAGALTYANIDKVDEHFKDINVSASPIALIVVGSIVFIIAFYGCCGAIRESHCMVVTFAVFLLVILIAEIAIGVVAFVNRDGWDGAIQNSVDSTFKHYEQTGNMDDVNALEQALQCCGINGTQYWSSRQPEPPKGCCVSQDDKASCTNYNDPKQVFQAGCVGKLREFLNSIGLILGALAVVVGCVEIVGVVFALCLASSIKNRDRRVY